MRRAGTKIRVTAELIAPETGEQFWTGRYDRDIGDLFALQDEITDQSVGGHRRRDRPGRGLRARSRPTTDLTAWDRFLRGLSHYYRQTKADLKRLDRPVPGGDRDRSDAVDRACLSRHDP